MVNAHGLAGLAGAQVNVGYELAGQRVTLRMDGTQMAVISLDGTLLRTPDVSGLRPADAVLVRKFGHLGITGGAWPLLGQLDTWQRQDWPTPVFIRYEERTGRSFHVFYDDNDPNRVLREQQVAPGEAEQASKDGLMGAGFTESILTRLLA